MVLIKNYGLKKFYSKDFLVILWAIILDHLHFFQFLPFDFQITLPVLFFLIVYREKPLPIGFIFFLGFFSDLLGGNAIGYTTFSLLVFYTLVFYSRLFLVNQDKDVHWVFLCFCIFVYTLSLWFTCCLLNKQIVSIIPVLMTYGTIVFMYPILSYVFLNFFISIKN